MKIINIIDSGRIINYGIWNAAINTSCLLFKKENIKSELWVCSQDDCNIDEHCFSLFVVPKKTSAKQLIAFFNLKKEDCIIITHGSWRRPSKLGYEFSLQQFAWIYVPHGMLEPWSLRQHFIKKYFYFKIFERRYIKNSTIIRAVSSREQSNLIKLLKSNSPKTVLIPNGVNTPKSPTLKKIKYPFTVLYLGRLHKKKGPTELLNAWIESKLNNNDDYQLIIAGPDEGELKVVNQLLEKFQPRNVKYIGSVYNDDKFLLFNSSTYFVLPSKSEGFPSSILEAMSFGLVPLISNGCNFNELFDEDLAIYCGTTVSEIVKGLNSLLDLNIDQVCHISDLCQNYVSSNYSLAKIANLQVELYNNLLRQ